MMDLNAFYKPMSKEYLFKKFKEYYRYLKKIHGYTDCLKFLLDCINNKRNFGDGVEKYHVIDALIEYVSLNVIDKRWCSIYATVGENKVYAERMKSICGYSNTGDTLLGYIVSKIPSYSIAVFKETCLDELLDLDYEERDYFDGEVTLMLFEFIEWADWSEWRDTMNESGIIIEEL